MALLWRVTALVKAWSQLNRRVARVDRGRLAGILAADLADPHDVADAATQPPLLVGLAKVDAAVAGAIARHRQHRDGGIAELIGHQPGLAEAARRGKHLEDDEVV